MQLKSWLVDTNTYVKSFARKVKVERAMIYRYYSGTLPRAGTIRRIEILTDGAVTAQDFYACALKRMKGADTGATGAVELEAPANATPFDTSRLEAATRDAPNVVEQTLLPALSVADRHHPGSQTAWIPDRIG